MSLWAVDPNKMKRALECSPGAWLEQFASRFTSDDDMRLNYVNK